MGKKTSQIPYHYQYLSHTHLRLRDCHVQTAKSSLNLWYGKWGWIELESAHDLLMNLNLVFSKSMNLNLDFSKSMNLNLVFLKSINLNLDLRIKKK